MSSRRWDRLVATFPSRSAPCDTYGRHKWQNRRGNPQSRLFDASNDANGLEKTPRSAPSQRDHSPDLLQGDGRRDMSVRAIEIIDRGVYDDLEQVSSGEADNSAPRPVHRGSRDAETVGFLSDQ
jgi:hypothetical protein